VYTNIKSNFIISFSISFFIFLTHSVSSHAFSLSDHSRITARAVAEFNQCVFQAYSEEDFQLLERSNLSEDLNFLNKWLKYSHYYRPFETLDFYWRSDSSARLANLNASAVSLEVLGEMMHYIQDAASPPHVIPVSHGLTDGFERYTLSNPELFDHSLQAQDCDQLLHPSVTQDIVLDFLSATGVATLHLLSKFSLHAMEGETEKVLTSSSFWQESPMDTDRGVRPFGQYGELGNVFGESELTLDDKTYQVSDAEYDRIKISYLRLGVEMSKKLLAYEWASRH
jgi:hypothetical protein